MTSFSTSGLKRSKKTFQAELQARDRNVSEVGHEVNLAKQKIAVLEVALELVEKEKEKLVSVFTMASTTRYGSNTCCIKLSIVPLLSQI